MQISFKDLRSIITKCCTAEHSDDIASRFGFSIDLVKMENILKQKKSFLHVIGFSKNVKSRVPYTEDLQMISEYVYGEQMDSILNGKSQICSFMIFSKCTQEGVVEISMEDGTVLTDKQIFDKCNNSKNVDLNTARCILNNFPIYRIIIAKVFDAANEKFEYKVYIRSNHQMVDFYKFLTDNPDFLENVYAEYTTGKNNADAEQKTVEETVEETVETVDEESVAEEEVSVDCSPVEEE